MEIKFWWVVIHTTAGFTLIYLQYFILHPNYSTCISGSWSYYFISFIVEAPDDLIHFLWCMSLWSPHTWRCIASLWLSFGFFSLVRLPRLIRSMLVILLLNFLHDSNLLIWNNTWLLQRVEQLVYKRARHWGVWEETSLLILRLLEILQHPDFT